MAEVLFARLHDCDIVVSLAVTTGFACSMLLLPALVKLKLFAEHIAGSLNLSCALSAAQSIEESNITSQSHTTAQGMHTTHQVTEMRKWQVCLALFTVLRCELCLILWLFTGQYWVQSINMFTARRCAMLSNALLMRTETKFMCSYASSIAVSWPA